MIFCFVELTLCVCSRAGFAICRRLFHPSCNAWDIGWWGMGLWYFTACCKDFQGNSTESSHTSLLLGCLGIFWLPHPGGGYVFEVFAVLSPYHKELNRTPGMPFMLNSLIGHWRNCVKEKLMCCRFSLPKNTEFKHSCSSWGTREANINGVKTIVCFSWEFEDSEHSHENGVLSLQCDCCFMLHTDRKRCIVLTSSMELIYAEIYSQILCFSECLLSWCKPCLAIATSSSPAWATLWK